MPNQIVALHNNDVVFITWRYESAIENCLGFTVRRKESGQPDSAYAALPAWVGWQGGSNQNWQAKDTDTWPVQKFNWRDFTAKPGKTYIYQVIPMVGAPGSLNAQIQLKLTTPPIPLTPDTADGVSAYFTNGILSTQHVAHFLPPGATGGPSATSLIAAIKNPHNQLRKDLAGEMPKAICEFLQQATTRGGTCYCALYELNDPQLVPQLVAAKGHVEIVLSDAGVNDGTNQQSRHTLHTALGDKNVTDRMLDQNKHIGHNKFVVYVDSSGQAKAVLTGSTNWTYTGLCAQSNNTVIIVDDKIAEVYKNYWNRLKQDTVKAGKNVNDLQAPGFRTSNNKPNPVGTITVWFSPNTKGVSKGKATPGDMQDIFAAIENAKQAILFLEFQPGTPSVLDKIKEMESANPKLFIRGAATDAKAIEKFDEKHPITTELYHRTTAGNPDQVFETGVAATAVNDTFAYWKKELLKTPGGHAIIHDKIVVIDPLSPACVVITGSHNQGFKASYCNDENLLIIRGNQELAKAYATHVMDVYDHYRWRYSLQNQAAQAWTGLQTTPDWQDRYFQPASMAAQELDFWFAVQPAVTTPKSTKPKRPTPPKPVKVMKAAAGAGGHSRRKRVA